MIMTPQKHLSAVPSGTGQAGRAGRTKHSDTEGKGETQTKASGTNPVSLVSRWSSVFSVVGRTRWVGLVSLGLASGRSLALTANPFARADGAFAREPTKKEWQRIDQQLDEILATQQEILTQLEQAVEDAKILKVRANRRRAP